MCSYVLRTGAISCDSSSIKALKTAKNSRHTGHNTKEIAGGLRVNGNKLEKTNQKQTHTPFEN